MNLVISVIGNKSIHDVWLKDNRNFDVVLICYEDEIYHKLKAQKKKGVKVYRKNGFHFPLIKWFFEKYKTDKYDQFLFINHDIFVTAEDINTCFELQKNFDVKIGHPAINKRNNPTGALWQNKDTSLTYVNWVELMAVFFSKDALELCLPYFDENNTGYGYPHLWEHLLIESGIDKEKVFTKFDKVEIIHTEKVDGENSIYKANNQSLEDAKQDMFDLQKKFGLEQKINEYKEYKQISSKPLLTTVVIYSEEDEGKYLYENMMTTPNWSERVYCKTVPNTEKAGTYKEIMNEGGIIKIEYYYKEGTEWNPLEYFNFAEIRNTANSLAKSKWILSLDADERLLQHQHNKLYGLLMNASDDIGGFFISNAGMDTSQKNELGQYKRDNAPQVKIFRNEGFFYQDGIHETVAESIEKRGYIMPETPLLFHHVGYEITIDEMQEKQRRNILGYVNNKELLKSKGHWQKFIDTCEMWNYYEKNKS